MYYKKCSRCKERKSRLKFNKNSHKKDGLQGYCSACQRSYQNEWNSQKSPGQDRRTEVSRKRRRRRNRKFIINILSNTVCQDCGESNPVVLDFDHVRGYKVAAISTMVGGQYGISRLQKEVGKCEVVCANCHRIREANRNNNHWIHKYRLTHQ